MGVAICESSRLVSDEQWIILSPNISQIFPLIDGEVEIEGATVGLTPGRSSHD